MPIYGGSVDSVAQYDRFREAQGAQQAQYLSELGFRIGQELRNRKDRERQFRFGESREQADAASDKERMALERAKLDEMIRANKAHEAINSVRFGPDHQPASVTAAETAARSRLEMENLKQGERTRENYTIARNMSELLNQYQDIPEAEAELKNWLPATQKRAGELDTNRLGFGRWKSDAERMALDERRGQIPYNIPIDVSQDETADALARRATGALTTRKEMLGTAIDQGMRTGADLIRQDPSGRWYPGVPADLMPPGPTPSAPSRGAMMGGNPQAFRFVQKATELTQQREALTNAIDQVEAQTPSLLFAPPELHKHVIDAQKQSKELRKNLISEQKDIETRLQDLQKEAEEKAEREKEEGKKSVDVREFSPAAQPTPRRRIMFEQDVRKQAQAAIAAGKDPVAVIRRALELGVDLTQ